MRNEIVISLYQWISKQEMSHKDLVPVGEHMRAVFHHFVEGGFITRQYLQMR
jgi:hypothetical protein